MCLKQYVRYITEREKTQNKIRRKKIPHREWMHIYILYKGYAFDRFSLEYISIYECQEKKHNGNQNLSHSL